MGSTDSQKASAEIPSQAMPFVGQANSYISDVAKALPNYSNFLNSPQGGQVQNFANMPLGPGGSLGAQNSLYNNILSGSFLNPSSNPYMQNVMNASNQNFQQNLGGSLDQLSSFMNLQGQRPTSSGAFGNAAGNLTRNAMQDQGNSINAMLYGNYNQSMQDMLKQLQAGNPMMASLAQGLPMFDLGNTLAMQQTQANAIPANLYNAFLGNLPMSMPQYGQSEFAQNFGMGTQGLTALSAFLAA